VLRKGGDVGRRGGSGEMVAVWFCTIRKWIEMLRRRMMWRGCIDKESSWWCVRSWDGIRMVHQSMGNGSRVADKLNIKGVLLALEDFLLFSLYSFSCIAKQVTTLKQVRLLSCFDSLETHLEPLALFSDITLMVPVSPTSDPAHYTRTSLGITYLILNVPTSLD